MLNMEQLRVFITDILDDYFKSEREEYAEYTDVERFCEIAGISTADFEKKVKDHSEFNCIYRFENSNKRYVHTRSGLQALRRILKRE